MSCGRALAIIALGCGLIWSWGFILAPLFRRRETLPHPYCMYPQHCEADDDGYCAMCHSNLYP